LSVNRGVQLKFKSDTRYQVCRIQPLTPSKAKLPVIRGVQLDKVNDRANITAKKNRNKAFVYSRWLYRYCNLIERFFNKISQFTGLATRYDKKPDNSLAAIKFVSLRIWIRAYESTP